MPRTVPLAALVALLALPHAAAARRPVRSMLELRTERVVRQGFDLSCGAAALSTLLTFEQRDPVSEPEVVAGLLRHADPERIRRQGGFTLLDLKRFATARGYVAQGYGGLDLASLAALGPAIVATVVNGQPHFMVFRGIVRGRVILADPAYGNRTLPAERFEALWSPRLAFVVRRPAAAPPPPSDGRQAALVPDPVIRGIAGWTR
jgi:predicted double-glycine peptidase